MTILNIGTYGPKTSKQILIDAMGGAMSRAAASTVIGTGIYVDRQNVDNSDGTSDDVEIQAAIDGLTSGRVWKETVKLIGSFNVSTMINGASNMILDCTEAELKSVGNVNILQWASKTDFELIGGLFDGDSQTDNDSSKRSVNITTCTKFKVWRSICKNSGYYGINLFDCDDGTLIGVEGNDNYRHGIHNGADGVGLGYRCDFVACRATGNGNDGINDRGSSQAAVKTLSVYTGCVSYSNTGSGFGFGGQVESATPANIVQADNCLSYGNTGAGADFQWTQAYVNNMVCNGNTTMGFWLGGCYNVNLFNCDGSDNGAGASNAGIKVTDAGTTGCSYITVIGGKYTGNYRNFYITTAQSADYITVENADLRSGTDANFYSSGTVTNLSTHNNKGYVGWGETRTIRKIIGHASLTDNLDATAYIDFDDQIAATSVILSVYYSIYEKWNSDDTTTLRVMVGIAGDLDAYTDTADPGENVFNTWNGGLWVGSDCQENEHGAAATPRVTFTEDDDGTDIINSGNAAGGLIMYITYLKA